MYGYRKEKIAVAVKGLKGKEKILPGQFSWFYSIVFKVTESIQQSKTFFSIRLK